MISDEHIKAGYIPERPAQDQFKVGMVGGMAAQAAMLNSKQSTLQDVTQRLRVLMAEARRSEEHSEELLSRMLGSGLSGAIAPESDGPSNGFINDTIELINQAHGALERSNANMRRLQNAVMPHGVEQAAE